MVNAKNMTADEARAYLIKLQERTKQRQQQYVNDKKQKGQRRINTFLSTEASKVLTESQERTGMTVGELLSEALLVWAEAEKTPKKAVNKPKQKKVNVVSKKHIDKNERNAVKNRIMELTGQGKGPAEIARTLVAEGVPPPGGGSIWHRGTVSRIIRRLHK